MTGVGAAWLPWLRIAGVILLIGGLVFVAWWSLFSDRARGRRRCPRCWYDLAWTPGMSCAECGYLAADERELHRTRRRWGLGIVAIAGCAGVGAAALDTVIERGWMSYVPSSALVWVMPVSDRAGVVFGELDRRMRAGDLDDGQWLAVLERCASGDGSARPASDTWIDKYGSLTRECMSHFTSHPDAAHAAAGVAILHGLPPALTVSTRPLWPTDAAATVEVRAQDWWPRGTQWRVRARPQLPGARPVRYALRGDPIQARSFSVALPMLAEGHYAADIGLEVERSINGGAWTIVHQTVEQVTFNVSGALADTLTPVVGADADAAVRTAFSRRPGQYQGGGSLPVRFGIDMQPTLTELFEDTAVAVRLELLRNGEVGRRLDIWWRGGALSGSERPAWEVPFWNDDILGAPLRPEDRWEVRIRSAPDLALRVEGATKYWSGEASFEVVVSAVRRTAPPRGWILEE
jgi:hypothetical protein